MRPTPTARSTATRQRLLDAALEVFDRRGVHDARIDDVCRAAGVARATFYRYFDGKDDVLLALHDELAAEILRVADALGPVTPDPSGLATLHRWVDAMLALSERWVPVVAWLSEARDPDSAVRRRSVSMTARFSRQVGRRFAEGGVVDVDAAMAALAVVALVDGVSQQVRTWGLAPGRHEVVEALTGQVLVMLHPGLDLRAVAGPAPRR
ncbi:MAG TPA: TetR/AcrR family transcriptional regulator [Acidimicrobiales bacterium]|nr:TetR/AcrR family transcriptional regulator [Acidimicrobiales bacterium]